MGKVDLHIHSKTSNDGEFTAEQILYKCRAAGVSHIAITDHNSTRSVQAALDSCAEYGVKVLPGIEMDTMHRGNIFHTLGYGIDHTDPRWQRLEEDIHQQELDTADTVLRLFREETGISVSREEVKRVSGLDVVAGEHIAEVLLHRDDAGEHEILKPYMPGGERSDNPYVNFYWDYFSQGKPMFVEMRFMSMADALQIIHDTGGIAVLAHPKQNLGHDEDMLQSIIELGIDGIEIYCSYHSPQDSDFFLGHAEGLIQTCGSDFHGKTKPAILLGGHGAPEDFQGRLYSLFGE